MPVTAFDGLLLVVVLISAILAAFRGFTREMLAILSWVLAAVAAFYFYEKLMPYTLPYSEALSDNKYFGIFVAAAPIFLLTLVVVSYVTVRFSNFVLESAIGPLDRSLGFLFGALRGVLLAVVALIFFDFLITPTQQPQWVAQAKSKPFLEHIGQVLIEALPEDAGQKLLDKLDENKAAPSVPSEEESEGGEDAAPSGKDLRTGA